MKKFYFSLFILLISYSVMNAEIKLIQIKVLDNVDPESEYTRTALFGSLPMNDQTSFVLPVKNKKIQGMNMPFIKGYGHEVLLVGPFLDMCGDIKILNQSNSVIATIKTSSFIAKGKNDFWFPNERRKKNEGFVKFRISKTNMDKITTQNFKIKVGNVENLDVVDCLIADRFEIDAILFTGTSLPTREVGSVNGISTIKNTFESNNNYQVSIKINGGVIPRYTYKLFNDELLYHHSSSTFKSTLCLGNLTLSGNITKGKLIENNDALMMNLRSSTMSEIDRRGLNGYLIGLIDSKISEFTGIELDENAEKIAFGVTLSREQSPNSWGPYIFARISSEIYKFGRYTDLGIIEIGECKTGITNGSSTKKPIFIKAGTDQERGIR